MADNFVQHLTKGGELLRSDRVEEARVELEAARALRPNDLKALSLLGLVYFRIGRFDEARTIYTELVGKQANDASLRLNLGLVLLKIGDTRGAIDELQRARDLDPGQTRTLGYLGLAYARAGEYAKAKDAFTKAGQDELAREMEQYLQGPAQPAAAPAAPAAPPPAEEKKRKAEAKTVPIAAVAIPAPISESVPTPAHDGPTTRTAQGVVAERVPSEGVVSAAVRVAELPAPTRASLSPETPGAPLPVGVFATARLIRPDDGETPLSTAAGDTLIVRVRGRVLSRTEGVIVSGGELSYEPATKRIRGRQTDEPFGSDARPMFVVSGHGHLVASPRGGKFTALELIDDALYVREELVFAFEERLRWENGHVPGSAGGVHVVQFRGEGCVAMRTRSAPLTVKLLPEKVLYIDADLLAGWIGRVVPRVVAPAAGGEASAPFVECSGEGMIIVLEPADADAITDSTSAAVAQAAAHPASPKEG